MEFKPTQGIWQDASNLRCLLSPRLSDKEKTNYILLSSHSDSTKLSVLQSLHHKDLKAHPELNMVLVHWPASPSIFLPEVRQGGLKYSRVSRVPRTYLADTWLWMTMSFSVVLGSFWKWSRKVTTAAKESATLPRARCQTLRNTGYLPQCEQKPRACTHFYLKKRRSKPSLEEKLPESHSK